MRRILGTSFMAVGAALLVFVGLAYAKGALARDNARTEWEALEAKNAIAVANQRLDRSAESLTLARGAAVGRLIIPTIRLDEIVVEGVDAKQLNAGPGHLPESVLPGESGNAVISAHRDRHFHGLDALAVGDTVVTETLRGRVAWVVVGRRVVERDEPALFTTIEPTLTLTTCWPVRYLGPAPDRLLITAKPIRANRSENA